VQATSSSYQRVDHIAIAVDDVHGTMASLRECGLAFDGPVIEGPGLPQAFSTRCTNWGLAFEFICRADKEGFLEANVQKFFEELERTGAY
jgi:4-hydroxyphenylpyruvate dioxygenase-like putative hemolysin